MEYQDESELPKVRPGWLTAICVLAIVFGVLGLLAGGATVLSQLFASRLQQAIASAQIGANQPGAELQAEVMTRTMAIATKYNLILIPLGVGKVLVEIAL